MEKILIFIIALSASCARHEAAYPLPETGPIDGHFWSRAEYTVQECYGIELAPDSRFRINVMQRFDGSVDISSQSFVFPGPGFFEAVDIGDGRIKSESGQYALNGTLTPKKLDLAIEETGWENCRQKAQISGIPRRLADPKDLDGYYMLKVSYYGTICGALYPLSKPLDEWKDTAEIVVYKEGLLWIDLGGRIFLSPDPPAADGSVKWEGPSYINSQEGASPYAALSGKYGPEKVDLIMEQWMDSEKSGSCRSVYKLSGKKWLPSLANIDNRFRARITQYDTCDRTAEETNSEEYRELIVLSRLDGRLEIRERSSFLFLEIKGNKISSESGSKDNGYTRSISGIYDPPIMDINITNRYYDEKGQPDCSSAITIEGRPRFIFENTGQ